MARRLSLLLLLACNQPGARAAVLPPDKLLPRDTVLVMTIPDVAAARILMSNTPLYRLWNDPALKPFRDKFTDKYTSDVLTPLEHSLGVRLSDYPALAQGQATFALLPPPESAPADEKFQKIFILDTKDRAPQLRTNLADIRQKWIAAGKTLKSVKIRDVEFTTLFISPDDLSWDKLTGHAKTSAPDDEAAVPAASAKKSELTFGQIDSLLLVGDSVPALEKVLTRQEGGLLPALEEDPLFQADYAARLRGAPVYAWANIKKSIYALTRDPAPGGDSSSPVQTALNAVGISGLTTACLSYRSLPEGISTQVFVGAPEAQRRGIFRVFVPEAKDANPPAFVPADAVSFWRWRIDISHGWTELEKMMGEVNPQASSLLNFFFQSAGKDKDPNYDFKAELLANLGDDVIGYSKAPRGNTPAELDSPPSLQLIGSPNPEKLAAAIKTGLGFMGTTKDREFLGRQICTLSFQTAPSRAFSFSGSGGYLALSSDAEILEEYLRSNEGKGRPLSDTPGLAEAAQKVGGMGTGLFGFENQNAGMRSLFDLLRQKGEAGEGELGTPSAAISPNISDDLSKLRAWADYSLLPPYDNVSQYFYFSVFALSVSSDGFSFNYFSPTPPKLR